eukprot:CAMPEP_0119127282 /NCGR_PEP_ID=MMETSP1310-20130426/5890_1 /TAXON_ID=464262 /ORGANISM="Genus nov. species nov., Strain RCC2339" /LENGTH=295 /DNA_ID=CAMNT_0007117527 /DNA_START=24 /DNA_END=911 /DNA_ORIENTATION=+
MNVTAQMWGRTALLMARGRVNIANFRAYSGEAPRNAELLKGRVCLVTNCDVRRSHYLPNEIANSLAEYGATVMVHGVDDDVVEELAKSLPTPLGSTQKHGYVECDGQTGRSPVKAAEKIYEQLQERTDHLDVLVNNAGTVDVPPVGMDEYAVDEFDRVVRLDLTNPFALVKKLVPLLAKGKASKIILTSTEVDFPRDTDKGLVVGGAYYVSQFGFRASSMLTKLMARELHSRRIQVNTVDPGRVFLFKTPKEIPHDSDRTIPYVWLARANTKMTGEQLDVKDWLRRDPSMFTRGY